MNTKKLDNKEDLCQKIQYSNINETVKEFSDGVLALAGWKNLVAIGSYSSSIRVIDATTKQEKNYLVGHNHFVYCIEFSQHGNRLYSSSHDKNIIIWCLKQSKILHKIEAHISPIFSISVIKDENQMISGSGDRNVKVWDLINMECIKTITKHTQSVTLVKYVQQQNFISASDDFLLCLWNQKFENIACVEFTHNTQAITQFLACTDLKIAVCGPDQYISILDINTLKTIRKIKNSQDCKFFALYFTPNGNQLITGDFFGRIQIYDENYEITDKISSHSQQVTCITYLNILDKVVSGADDIKFNQFHKIFD